MMSLEGKLNCIIDLLESNDPLAQSTVESIIDTLVQAIDTITDLKIDIEQTSIKLAACGISAQPVERDELTTVPGFERLQPDNPYYCDSLKQVYKAVDRLFDEKEKNERLMSKISILTSATNMLTGRVVELQKNSDRYDWLRNNNQIQCIYQSQWGPTKVHSQELDRMIDEHITIHK